MADNFPALQHQDCDLPVPRGKLHLQKESGQFDKQGDQVRISESTCE